MKKCKLRTGIEVIQGLPGAGKSTLAAYFANKHLKSGYNVYSNFPIDGCRMLDVDKDLMVYNVEHALIIIDEAGIDFDSRDWSKFKKEWTEFFKTHRHYHLRIMLFTQIWDDIDKKIRSITKYIYCVEHSILPYFIKVKGIQAYITISEEHKIELCYDWVKWYKGGIKLYYVKNARKMFDSWIRKPLKERPAWPVWSVKQIDSRGLLFGRLHCISSKFKGFIKGKIVHKA